MKNLYLVLFLTVFCFTMNEVFVFGQENEFNGDYDSDDAAYRNLIAGVEDKYDSDIGSNEAYVFSREMKLLNYYRNQLANDAGESLGSRIEDLQNVLDDTTDMYCTTDEDNLNQKLVNLNLAYDGYESGNDQTQNLMDILEQKESELRGDIITAIDKVIRTKGVCDNTTASELRKVEENPYY